MKKDFISKLLAFFKMYNKEVLENPDLFSKSFLDTYGDDYKQETLIFCKISTSGIAKSVKNNDINSIMDSAIELNRQYQINEYIALVLLGGYLYIKKIIPMETLKLLISKKTEINNRKINSEKNTKEYDDLEAFPSQNIEDSENLNQEYRPSKDNAAVPPKVEGTNDAVYSGFWPRLGALLLDCIFFSIPMFIFGRIIGDKFFLNAILVLAFLLYFAYLPKRYGWTPGKLILGLKIIRIDSLPIGWKEAFLRQSDRLFCFILASLSDYTAPDTGMIFINVIIFIFGIADLIIFFTNEKRRRIFDMIAGTVVIKSKYAGNIRENMNVLRQSADTPSTPSGGTDDSVATLKKLKDMLDLGLIEKAEFDAKKAEIMSKM